MLTTTITFAAAQEAPRGWGGPVALLIVAVIYIAGSTIHHHFRGGDEDPSPTPGDTPGVSVKPQVSAVSDTDDTDPDTTGDTDWWAHPRLTGRRTRRVLQVLRTGSTAEADGPDEDEEDETGRTQTNWPRTAMSAWPSTTGTPA